MCRIQLAVHDADDLSFAGAVCFLIVCGDFTEFRGGCHTGRQPDLAANGDILNARKRPDSIRKRFRHDAGKTVEQHGIAIAHTGFRIQFQNGSKDVILHVFPAADHVCMFLVRQRIGCQVRQRTAFEQYAHCDGFCVCCDRLCRNAADESAAGKSCPGRIHAQHQRSRDTE